MIIRRTCRAIAEGVIANIDQKDDNLDVRTLEKRLDVLAIYICLAFTLCIVGIALGNWLDILIATAAFATIRIINQGNHFNSPDLCYLVTTSAIVLISILPHWSQWLGNCEFLLCAICYSLCAPNRYDSGKKYIGIKTLLVMMIFTSFLYIPIFLNAFLILLPDLFIRNYALSKLKRTV